MSASITPIEISVLKSPINLRRVVVLPAPGDDIRFIKHVFLDFSFSRTSSASLYRYLQNASQLPYFIHL